MSGHATRHRVRPCGCTYDVDGYCDCDVSCGYCWPDFKDEQHEIALQMNERRLENQHA